MSVTHISAKTTTIIIIIIIIYFILQVLSLQSPSTGWSRIRSSPNFDTRQDSTRVTVCVSAAPSLKKQQKKSALVLTDSSDCWRCSSSLRPRWPARPQPCCAQTAQSLLDWTPLVRLAESALAAAVELVGVLLSHKLENLSVPLFTRGRAWVHRHALCTASPGVALCQKVIADAVLGIVHTHGISTGRRPWQGTDLQLVGSQPDTSQRCRFKDTGQMCRMVWPFTSQLMSVPNCTAW